jgi:TATA-box binding protein (TBP) (component of TFIID and TFIIIB)
VKGQRIQGNLLNGNEEQHILNSVIFRTGRLVLTDTKSEEQAIKPLEIFLINTDSK